MWFLNKKIKVAVHDGHFHADDVFAVAILSLYLNKPIKIFRTRDEQIYKQMDYLLDVGRQYDPISCKFDHHQDSVPLRENGVPYATCGLVWKEFGEKICGSNDVAGMIETKIIQTIDANDSGIDIHKKVIDNIEPYYFIDYVFSLNPSWNEKELTYQAAFEGAVELVKKMLKREIKKTHDYFFDKNEIDKIYKNTSDKRIIIFDFAYAWKKIISDYPEPLIVIRPVENVWWSSCVLEKDNKFKNRINFPQGWSAKTGADLIRLTGVDDAIFCHKNLFMCAAKTKEGAIKLAELALKEAENNK